MKLQHFRDTGRFHGRPAEPRVVAPRNLNQLQRCLNSDANVALPIRPRGAGSSVTDCNAAPTGTVIDMTGFNRILHIDAHHRIVRAEAGVRVGELIAALAEHGLELSGNFEQTERTLGGAVAAPCLGPGIGNQASCLSSQVLSMRIVTANGKAMKIGRDQRHLLGALRMSYGTLGIIYELTLRVREIMTFSASHRSMDIGTFATVADRLAGGDVGMKFYLLPYRNHAYLDLRHYQRDASASYNAPWKIKEWSESTILPHVFKSLSHVMPIPSVRYRLVDSLSAATQELVNTRFVRTGNNVAASGRHRRRKQRNLLTSTWCFPACDFSVVVQAYAKFCRESFARTGYRCDMPALGYRIAQDNSALLSPSFDEALFAVQTTSTQRRGWDDFVLDLAEFAEHWGGTPLFNQTLATRAEYVAGCHAGRLAFFRKIRGRLDPERRLLNPFLSRYFG